MGSLYLRGRTWWVKWHSGGEAFYRSSGSQDRADAVALLERLEAEAWPPPARPRKEPKPWPKGKPRPEPKAKPEPKPRSEKDIAKARENSAEAGRANWARETALVVAGKKPAHNIVHGGRSRHVRRRFTDKRTSEGQQLLAVMNQLTSDLGGEETLNAGQKLRLDTVRTLLISLMCIGKYVDKQPELIVDGDLLPVLKDSFLKYSRALKDQLDSLYASAKTIEAVPDLGQYITSQYGKKGKR